MREAKAICILATAFLLISCGDEDREIEIEEIHGKDGWTYFFINWAEQEENLFFNRITLPDGTSTAGTATSISQLVQINAISKRLIILKEVKSIVGNTIWKDVKRGGPNNHLFGLRAVPIGKGYENSLINESIGKTYLTSSPGVNAFDLSKKNIAYVNCKKHELTIFDYDGDKKEIFQDIGELNEYDMMGYNGKIMFNSAGTEISHLYRDAINPLLVFNLNNKKSTTYSTCGDLNTINYQWSSDGIYGLIVKAGQTILRNYKSCKDEEIEIGKMGFRNIIKIGGSNKVIAYVLGNPVKEPIMIKKKIGGKWLEAQKVQRFVDKLRGMYLSPSGKFLILITKDRRNGYETIYKANL